MCACADAATTYTAQVVRVMDGDSMVIRDDRGREIRVRLEGVDAPERYQPFATQSRASLRALTAGRILRIEPRRTDSYGRTVAKIFFRDRDLGLEQIRLGMAWHYRHYAKDQSPNDRLTYERTEREAKQTRLGLWQQKDPVPPWRFRQDTRQDSRR